MKKIVKLPRFKMKAYYEALTSIKGLEGQEVLHARRRTLQLLEKPYEALEPNEKVKEFQKKLRALQEEFAGKDAKGNIKKRTITVGDSVMEVFDFDANSPAFKERFDALKDEYQEEIDKYEAWMKQEDEYEIFTFDAEFAPSKQAQYEAVEFIMTEQPA